MVNSSSQLVLVGICSAVGGSLIFKIISEYLDKSKEYVTIGSCKKNQESCPQNTLLKEQFIEHKTQVSTILQQYTGILKEIQISSRQTSEHLGRIDTAIAVLVSTQNTTHIKESNYE